MSENKTPEVKPINPAVVEMAAKIREKMKFKIDGASATAEVTPDTYVSLLPDSLTEENVVALQDHNTIFAAASLLATGDEGIPLMKKHKGLESVTAVFPTVGKDNFEVQIDRTRQVPDRGSEGVSGTKTKYGSGSVTFNMYGTKTRGDLSKVKASLSAKAFEAFGE